MDENSESSPQGFNEQSASHSLPDLNKPLNVGLWKLDTAILRVCFDKAPDPQLIFNPFTGLIIRANKAATELFGLPLKMIVSRSIGQLYPDEAGILHLITEESLDKGFSRSRELLLNKPDGKPHRLEHTAVAASWEGQT